MKIIIYQNREVYKEESKIGNDSENKVETLEFEFPEEYRDFTKYIEFQIKGEKYVDLIEDNKYVITREVAKYGKIKTQVVLKKNTENDVMIFKSNVFELSVSKSINATESIIHEVGIDLIEKIVTKNSEQDVRLDTLEADNTANKENISILQNDNTTNKFNIKSLQDDNEANKTDIEGIKQEQATQNTNIQELQTDNTSNKAKIESLEIKNTEQDTNIQKNTNEIKTINEKNKSQDTEITNIKSEQVTQNTNIQNNTEDIAAINKKDTAQDKLIEQLQTKVVNLEAENVSLKNQIPSGEATGNPIHLSDSSDMKCEIVPIGESKEKLYLPEEYTQLEYIESSGTQYIDTGFKPNQNSGVETLVETYDTNVLYNNPFGARNENQEQFFVGIQTSPDGNNKNSTWFLRYETQYYISEFGIKYGQNHIILNKNIYTINGDSYTFNSTIFQSSNNMYLFACNNNGKTNNRGMRGKMYYFKLYDNDVLIRNMIPCIRKSDNVVGMYDTVNNLFYENSGTGNFIAGPELTKSPDYPSEIVTVGQNGSVEIEVCNKNLFDKNNINKLVGYVDGNGNFNTDKSNTRTLYISCMANTDYVVSRVAGQFFRIASFSEEIKNTVHMINGITNKPTASKLSINTGDNAKYLAVTYYNSTNDTLTEQEILNSIQIELGSEATDYIPHESYTKVLPIQQEMCKIGDYEDTFVKVDGKWYEQHNIKKLVLDGTESWSKSSRTDINRYVLNQNIGTILNAQTIDIICSHFKAITPSQSDAGNIGIAKYNNTGFLINIDVNDINFSTLEEFKTWLSNNNVTVYYVLATPELLECTEEQSAILNSFYTYKGITNISVDGIATLKVNYKKDLETIINNLSATSVAE